MHSRRKVLKQAAGILALVVADLTVSSLPVSAEKNEKINTDPTTLDNLMTTFAGESQANPKYLAFAEQAEKEGLTQATLMFRAIAASETIHALHHLRMLAWLATP